MKIENVQLDLFDENGEPATLQAQAAGPENSVSVESLVEENESLRNRLRTRDAMDELGRELRDAGAVSPELLSKAVADELQFGEDGGAVNVAALVEKLKKSFPTQFGRGFGHTGIDGGAGRNEARPLTKETLAKMSPAQIAALDWQEVRQVLSGR
ncbi:MAG TPA: hypothetical protein VHL50_11460 [Pyrinomonadaceae bacterium]|jgi:hypothetical protein|nr:hypothetical protein [Pyrinomonadaceae bacterium]